MAEKQLPEWLSTTEPPEGWKADIDPLPLRKPEVTVDARPSIFPDGVFAWYQLLLDLRREWPWPYTRDEIEQIGSLLPAPRAQSLQYVVWAARLYIYNFTEGPHRKSFVEGMRELSEEFEKLRQQGLAVLDRLGFLSSFQADINTGSTRQHILEAASVVRHLIQFEPYPAGFDEHLAPSHRPNENYKYRFLHRLKAAFEDAAVAAGGRKKKSFRAFRNACLAPLIEKGFFLQVSEKRLEDLVQEPPENLFKS